MAIRGIYGQPFLDLDEWIPIENLTALHHEIWRGIDRAETKPGVYVPRSLHTVDPERAPYRQIHLRKERNWHMKHRDASCDWTEQASLFSRLIEFIQRLPFAEIGRIKIFVNAPGAMVDLHRDHNDCYIGDGVVPPHDHEFIWMNTDPDKRLYIYDDEAREKFVIPGHSAFFNEVDLHGADPVNHRSFSIKVDGVFTDDFRRRLGLTNGPRY